MTSWNRPLQRAPFRRGRFALLGAALLLLTLAGCAEAPDLQSSPTDETTVEQTSKATAKVEQRRVRDTKGIPFATETIETSNLPEGEVQVQQAGRSGIRVRVIRITSKLGKVVQRDVVKTFVSRAPVPRVVLVGTQVDPQPPAGGGCDPNYAGACVPIASDVDCGGGSGDGPEYVDGPVRIVGDDIYDLNRDDDDIACDS